MSRDDIIKMAHKAGFNWPEVHTTSIEDRLERFAALVAAAERNRMIADGWRQCAQGQRTSQHCAVAEQARAEEREACARLVDPSYEHRRDASWGYLGGEEGVEMLDGIAAAVRARGQA
jgi:hypothetical protein